MADHPSDAAFDTSALPDQGQETTGIVRVRSQHQGQTVSMTFALAEGGFVELSCPHHLLPQVMVALRTAGHLSEKNRREAPGGAIDLIQPFNVLPNPRMGRGPDGSISIQFATADGFPISINIPLIHAVAIARHILREASAEPEPRIVQ